MGGRDNNRNHTTLARNLRRNSTDAERLLWSRLRLKQLEGVKFRRQHPLGSYIVDFVCLKRKLVIEVDGGQHLESESDRERDQWLGQNGFTVLRFWNNEVLGNPNGVLEVIRQHLIHPPLTPPSREGKTRRSLTGEKEK